MKMKKLFVVVVLVSGAAVACGSKKANTTPAGKAMETNPTGGAAYGGAAYGGHKDAAPAGKDTANPCAPK
jgi:hypothetical protein